MGCLVKVLDSHCYAVLILTGCLAGIYYCFLKFILLYLCTTYFWSLWTFDSSLDTSTKIFIFTSYFTWLNWILFVSLSFTLTLSMFWWRFMALRLKIWMKLWINIDNLRTFLEFFADRWLKRFARWHFLTFSK